MENESPDGISAIVTSPVASDKRQWLKVVAFGSGARLFGLASQFIVLIIMGRILPKSAFGNMMIAFAVYRILTTCIGTGLGNVLLYHVARSGGERKTDIRLHRSTALIGAVLSALAGLAIALFAHSIAAVADKPDLAPWLVHMAPFALFGTLNQIAMASLDGRSRITSSIVVTEVIPNSLRLIGLLGIAALSLPDVSVAHVIWISVAIPWAWEARFLLSRDVGGWQRWTFWDVKNAFHYALWTGASLQLQGIDLLVVGYLFNSSQAGDYAFASRIASLFLFLYNIASRQFTPMAAKACQDGRMDQLQEKLDGLKYITVCSVAMTCVMCIFGSEVVVTLILPKYIYTIPIIILFSLQPINRSFYFGNDRILLVNGWGFESLLIQLSSLLIMVVGSVLFSKTLSVAVLPLSYAVSSAVLNPITSKFVYRKIRLRFITREDGVLIAMASAALVAAAYSSTQYYATGLSCLALILLAAWLSVSKIWKGGKPFPRFG
jgi:O-antigen/teichoic acid export membrane protein